MRNRMSWETGMAVIGIVFITLVIAAIAAIIVFSLKAVGL